MNFKQKINEIIFGHHTFGGKLFDVVLIIMVILSVITVSLETVESLWLTQQNLFLKLEWFFTFIFTVELILRIYSSNQRLKYLFSFYGIVDLISILPTYLTFIFPSAKAFLIIRSMRILRLFRILKLSRYISAGGQLKKALISSREKIIIFIFFISIVVIIMGTAMYYIETPASGFTSIPVSIYWAVVTMTTVGYGDIAPATALGKFVSAFLMLIGYGVIAVPTGIISSEMNKVKDDNSSAFCSHCGKKL